MTAYVLHTPDAKYPSYVTAWNPAARPWEPQWVWCGKPASAARFTGRAAAEAAAREVEAYIRREGYGEVRLVIRPARGGLPISREPALAVSA